MCTKALKEAVVPVIKQTAFMLQLLKSTAMNILRGGGGGGGGVVTRQEKLTSIAFIF